MLFSRVTTPNRPLAQRVSFGNAAPDGGKTPDGQPQASNCLVGGLTSGIACGKTTVLGMFKDAGIAVYDVDSAVKEMWATDDDLNTRAIREFQLGPETLLANGKVDTKKLGKIVFQDKAKRQLLESWIHPRVRAKMNAFIEANRQARFILVEVPLLFESKMEGLFDLIITIRTTLEQQLQRLMNRNGLSQEDAQARINAQVPLSEKVQKTQDLGGVILDNSGTLDNTRQQVTQLLQRVANNEFPQKRPS